MDYIKRKICLEGARTRTQGLMPYYEFGKEYSQHEPYYVSVCNECDYKGDDVFDECPRCGSKDVEIKPACKDIDSIGLESVEGNNNGNWGHFVANPCFLAEKGKTYETMLHNYYSILNMVRSGVKLRKVETKNGEIIFTEDVGAFEIKGECFSGGTEPDYLYEYAAYDAENFTSVQTDSLREETRNIYRAIIPVEDAHDFIVLIKDYEKFQRYASYLDGITIPSSVTDNEIGDDIHKKWADFCEIVDDLIGNIKVPASIFNKHIKVPKSMPCADVKEYKDWLENYQSLSADCCNMRLWEDMGGEDMLDFLSDYEDVCKEKREKIEALEYSIPYIEIPLLIRQNYTDVGVLTNIDGVDYDETISGAVRSNNTRPHGYLSANTKYEECGLTEYDIALLVHSGVGLCIDQIIMSSATVQHPISGDSAIEVESLLWTLRDRKKYTDDKDNLLPGLFQKFSNPAGQMYACAKSSNEKYYRLSVVEHPIIIDEEEIIKYRIEYVEDGTLSEEDVRPKESNTKTSLPGYLYEFDNREEAETKLQEEEVLYPNDERNRYIIVVKDAVWEMKPLKQKPADCENGDGFESVAVLYGNNGDQYDGEQWETAEGKYYRTITTCEAGIQIAKTREIEANEKDELNAHYFFMVKYANSPESAMTIPYHEGNTANVYLVQSGTTGGTDWVYRGDFIKTITSGNSIFEATYVIGGYYSGDSRGKFISAVTDTGDIYYEKYTIQSGHVDYVAMDGVDNVPVYSDYIDFDGAAKEFYSPRYGLYRTGNTANIIKMTSGEFWIRKDGDGYSYANDAYLTKEEYLTTFSLPPKVDVNVTIDRGGVSAFEKHYKLSECNTMQDLVNYGNNFFNI